MAADRIHERLNLSLLPSLTRPALNIKVSTLAFCASVALAAPPATAQSKSFGEHGAFDVVGIPSTSDDSAAGCIMTKEFEGPGSTKMHVARFVTVPDDDIVWLTVENYNWTTKKDEQYENVSYVFGDGEYTRTAIGTQSSIYHGLLAGFPRKEFLDIFAKSPSLHIYRGETVVDKLNLDGSTAARAAFDRCWSWLKVAEAAVQKERHRYDQIPKDPFATPPPPRVED